MLLLHVAFVNFWCTCCWQVQAVIEIKESSYTFSVLDVVEIMGYGVGEEGKTIRYGKVMNLQGGTVHEIPIYQGCVSVEVNKSENDEYVIFRSMEIDDSSKWKIGELWVI